jgi:hypothetical protein
VKVSVVRGGGLAGLVETTTADSDRLGADDADSLRRKVAEARFFDLSESGGPAARGGADRFHYAVTVEDGDRAHTVRRSEPDLPETLGALIAWVSSLPAAETGLAPPGPSDL